MSARLLVVAGHDPSYDHEGNGAGGGAGVDADREAARHFGVEATCVVSAFTQQDGRRVRAVGARDAREWAREAYAALALDGAGRPAFGALKSGLLADAAAVGELAVLARIFAAAGLPVVVDPVLGASGGEVFLDEVGLQALRRELLPRGVILTPNLVEAARLAGVESRPLVAAREPRLAAARRILELGARAVVLKAGHGAGPLADDLLLERDRPPLWVTHERVPGASLHGSGCRHASALAAQLVRGAGLPEAVQGAARYLNGLLRVARPR